MVVEEKRGFRNAAEIGGLRVLRLMHDCTATALGYGIYKNDFQSGVTNVVIVDVGHCDTQVCVVAFEAGCMKVLAHGFDSNLGGRDFDEVLVRYFAGKFKEEYGIDVYSSARAIVRLRAACEKLKKVLSANPEAPLNIECLMEEKDVKGFIKRDDFESLSSELLERISIPCRQALLDSGLTVENIHTIELVGSGSRVPAMTKIISSLFRKEPSRTINASECVARGCALQCAMLSPAFRVRDYEVEDSFPYSIGFAFEEGPACTLPNGMLFPKGHPFPSVKMLSLNRSSTFQMEAYYAKENELPPGTPTKISMFTIGPFPASHAEKVKVKVRVQLNLHGIVTVESASLIKDHADDFQVKDNASVYSEDMEPPNLEASSSGNNVHSSSVFQKPIRRLDVHITENVYGAMTADEFALAKEKELQLVQQDVNMEQTKELKNTLESYVYDTRNKLQSTYRSFASDPERDGISFNLQQTEEWLYEDGYDESKDVYAEKLEDLKKMVDPVKQRYQDEEARAEATQNLLNNIIEYRMAAGSCSPSEKEAVNSECKKAEQWIRERSQQQDTLPKHADPVLWSGEIKRKTEALDAMCKHIMRSKSSFTKPEDCADREDNMRVD